MARQEVQENAPTAYQRALRRLARRDHSENELRQALLRLGYPETEVEGAVRRLRAERYLDDAAFAARFALSRMADRGLGRHRVRRGLRERGVAPAIVEEGLREALTEVSEARALDTLARRYWRQRAREEPERRLRGLWLFLVRRGFPAGLVHERLRALWPRFRDALQGLDPVIVEEDEGARGE
jgi:regulatory protein